MRVRVRERLPTPSNIAPARRSISPPVRSSSGASRISPNVTVEGKPRIFCCGSGSFASSASGKSETRSVGRGVSDSVRDANEPFPLLCWSTIERSMICPIRELLTPLSKRASSASAPYLGAQATAAPHDRAAIRLIRDGKSRLVDVTGPYLNSRISSGSVRLPFGFQAIPARSSTTLGRENMRSEPVRRSDSRIGDREHAPEAPDRGVDVLEAEPRNLTYTRRPEVERNAPGVHSLSRSAS